ncbi:hypothetical protein ACQP1W_21940 [Spirillospora sp. CA-255316]
MTVPNTPPGPAGKAPGDDVRVAGRTPAPPAPPSELEDTAPDRPMAAQNRPAAAQDRPPGEPGRAAPAGPAPAAEGAAAEDEGALPAEPPSKPATEQAAAEPAAGPTTGHAADRGADRLLDTVTADGFRLRLRGIQSDFVDDPGAAVRGADELAAEIVNAVGQALADRKRALEESARARGEGAPDGAPDTAAGTVSDTERLRLALHDYRDFVHRLLDL